MQYIFIVLHEIALTPSENIMPKTHKHPRWIPELLRGSWCFMLSGSCKLCASKIWCELGDSFQLKVKAFWINETRLSIKLKYKVFMHRTVDIIQNCQLLQYSSCIGTKSWAILIKLWLAWVVEGLEAGSNKLWPIV